jgi:hypothetical protein
VVDAEQRVLLQSPHFIQGVALMVGMSACTYLFLSAAAAAYRSNSSSNDGGSNGSSGDGAGGGSSSAGCRKSISFGWLADVTTDSELRRRVHEQCGIAMKRDSTSSSSDAVKQELYEWQSEMAMDKAWETASSQHQMLPEPFKMLLQLLGCNSKVGVWGHPRCVPPGNCAGVV